MPSTFPWKGRLVVASAGFMLLLAVFAFRSFTAVYGSGIDNEWRVDAAPNAVVADAQETQEVGSEAADPEPTYSVVLKLVLAVTTVLVVADLVLELDRLIERRFGDRS